MLSARRGRYRNTQDMHSRVTVHDHRSCCPCNWTLFSFNWIVSGNTWSDSLWALRTYDSFGCITVSWVNGPFFQLGYRLCIFTAWTFPRVSCGSPRPCFGFRCFHGFRFSEQREERRQLIGLIGPRYLGISNKYIRASSPPLRSTLFSHDRIQRCRWIWPRSQKRFWSREQRPYERSIQPLQPAISSLSNTYPIPCLENTPVGYPVFLSRFVNVTEYL